MQRHTGPANRLGILDGLAVREHGPSRPSLAVQGLIDPFPDVLDVFLEFTLEGFLRVHTPLKADKPDHRPNPHHSQRYPEFNRHAVSPCPVLGLHLVIEAVTTVGFVMLAAILIVALGPLIGLLAWLLCLGVVLFLARRLRRFVWDDQSRPNT